MIRDDLKLPYDNEEAPRTVRILAMKSSLYVTEKPATWSKAPLVFQNTKKPKLSSVRVRDQWDGRMDQLIKAAHNGQEKGKIWGHSPDFQGGPYGRSSIGFI